MRPPTRVHPSAHPATDALPPPWRPVAAQASRRPQSRPASGRGRHTFSLFDQSSRAPAPSVPLTPFDWEPRELPRLAAGTGLAHTKRFDVIEPIGEGGMGFVYRAYDPIMDRHVA